MTFSIKRLFVPLLILVPALALVACGGSDSPPVDNSEAVKKGEELVKSNACGGCHTPTTASDGLLAGQDSTVTMSSISGPNITPDKETGIGSWTDAQITAALRTGVDDKGEMLCASMPKFDFTDDETASVVAYLKSIPAVKRALPESTCQ